MENNEGRKSIDTDTLRRLLPLWAMAAGFETIRPDHEVIAVRCTDDHPLQQIGGWFGRIERRVRITDGRLLYKVDRKEGAVYVKMEKVGEHEGDKH